MSIRGTCKNCGGETTDYTCPVCLWDECEDAKQRVAELEAALAMVTNAPPPGLLSLVQRAIAEDPVATARIAELEAALAALGDLSFKQGLGWQQRAEAAEAKLAEVRGLIYELEVAKACAAGPGPLGAFHLAQTRIKQILDGGSTEGDT